MLSQGGPLSEAAMRADLVRYETGLQGTFGKLRVPSLGFSCFTLELPWQDNKRQVSCIPVGGYECRKVQSPRFGNVYGLKQVPGRSNILIHWGNYAGNVLSGFRTHSYGCILLGRSKGILVDQKAILTSLNTVRKLHKVLEGRPFDLIIQEIY